MPPPHAEAIYGFSRARLPEADARDVTAEVFRRTVEHLSQHPEAVLGPGWLRQVAHNLIIDQWRRTSYRGNRLRLLKREAELVIDVDQPDQPILVALDALSNEHRMVLIRFHVEGYRMAEIAEELGRTPRAVDSMLRRARTKLRKAYEEIDG